MLSVEKDCWNLAIAEACYWTKSCRKNSGAKFKFTDDVMRDDRRRNFVLFEFVLRLFRNQMATTYSFFSWVTLLKTSDGRRWISLFDRSLEIKLECSMYQANSFKSRDLPALPCPHASGKCWNVHGQCLTDGCTVYLFWTIVQFAHKLSQQWRIITNWW